MPVRADHFGRWLDFAALLGLHRGAVGADSHSMNFIPRERATRLAQASNWAAMQPLIAVSAAAAGGDIGLDEPFTVHEGK